MTYSAKLEEKWEISENSGNSGYGGKKVGTLKTLPSTGEITVKWGERLYAFYHNENPVDIFKLREWLGQLMLERDQTISKFVLDKDGSIIITTLLGVAKSEVDNEA